MGQRTHSASGRPAKTRGVAPPGSPRADRHDEWLLDEALTETFPASDPIAVSRDRRGHPLRTGPRGRTGKVDDE